jgi:UDP-N-acetylmuramoyl-tripeptide--D-alanyl-D-alanine ligase
MRISASDVARITSGTLVGTDLEANGISFDTRSLEHNQAFIAVVAERDGHDHLQTAAQAGAAFALVQRGRAVPYLSCVEVDDTVVALGLVAAECRRWLSVTAQNRVVGITGSAGKTSTKNMVNVVLSSQWANTHAAAASLNNDIGLPVTIINAPNDCEAIVLEMGMRGLGEIARLCKIASPTISVVTNVGDAHSERVGGLEGVARAKAEIVESLQADCIAILNADDHRVAAMASHTQAQVITFGTINNADIRAEVLETDDRGCITAVFYYKQDTASVKVPLPGQHMMLNAAAAAAVGVACGISLNQAVAAVAATLAEPGRMQWFTTSAGMRVLDDSYNANVASMLSALKVLSDSQATRRIAVLGRMSEIAEPEQGHARIAEYCDTNNIELLALETDLYGVQSRTVSDIIELIRVESDAVVVVKGSRAARTERVVQGLLL